MKRFTLTITLILAVALIPVALWLDDILILSLPALVPFILQLRNGEV